MPGPNTPFFEWRHLGVGYLVPDAVFWVPAKLFLSFAAMLPQQCVTFVVGAYFLVNFTERCHLHCHFLILIRVCSGVHFEQMKITKWKVSSFYNEPNKSFKYQELSKVHII